MRKFFVYTILIIVLVTFGVVIARLFRNREEVSILASNNFYNIDEQVSFDYKTKYLNKKSKIEIYSSDETVVAKNENGLFYTTSKGGQASIIVKLTNARKQQIILEKFITVGNGSEEFPFFVRSEQELRDIGQGSPEEVANKLTMHYLQTRDIFLTSEWKTIDGTLSGSFKGMEISDSDNVFKKRYPIIYNYSIKTEKDQTKNTSAMFDKIGSAGKFGYISFKNINIDGNFENACLIANENCGTIDYVLTSGVLKNYNTSNSAKTASLVIKNSKSQDNTARILRCENEIEITTSAGEVAGIVCENNANLAYLLNYGSTSIIDVDIDKNYTFGGIVAKNQFVVGEEFENYIKIIAEYDFSDETEELVKAKEAIVELLEKRPIIKDCGFMGDLTVDLAEDQTLNNACFGGIVGEQLEGYDAERAGFEHINDYRQMYDCLTIGNYYKAGDFSDDKRLIKRGIANKEYTQETENSVYDTNANFVAIGVAEEAFYDGIKTEDENGNEVPANFVSFVEDGRYSFWEKDTIFVYLKVNNMNQPPKIAFPTNNFAMLSLSVPNNLLLNINIRNINDFLSVDFTKLTATGAIKKYTVVGDIDFSKANYNWEEYYSKKGTKQKPAQFELYCAPITNEFGDYETDENGNVLHYGFKNLDLALNGEFAGIFGYIKNSKISNCYFENCNISNENTAKSFSLVCGGAEDSILEKIIIKNCQIDSSNAQIESIGVIVGSTYGNGGVTISTCSVNVVISGQVAQDGVVGSVVGVAGAGTKVSNVYVVVEANMQTGKIGGIAGTVEDGAEVQRCFVFGSLKATESAGLVYSLNGVLTACSAEIELGCVLNSAGAVGYLNSKAKANNLEIKTKFVGDTEASRCGLAIETFAGGIIENCIFENDFCGTGTNYSHSTNVSKVSFKNDYVEAVADTDYNYNVEKGAGEIRNCFFVNKVEGKVSYNTENTIFYRNKKRKKNAVDKASYNPTVITLKYDVQFVLAWPPIKYTSPEDAFGLWGAGVIDEKGEVVITSGKDKKLDYSLKAADFSDVYWQFEQGKIPHLK